MEVKPKYVQANQKWNTS